MRRFSLLLSGVLLGTECAQAMNNQPEALQPTQNNEVATLRRQYAETGLLVRAVQGAHDAGTAKQWFDTIAVGVMRQWQRLASTTFAKQGHADFYGSVGLVVNPYDARNVLIHTMHPRDAGFHSPLRAKPLGGDIPYTPWDFTAPTTSPFGGDNWQAECERILSSGKTYVNGQRYQDPNRGCVYGEAFQDFLLRSGIARNRSETSPRHMRQAPFDPTDREDLQAKFEAIYDPGQMNEVPTKTP